MSNIQNALMRSLNLNSQPKPHKWHVIITEYPMNSCRNISRKSIQELSGSIPYPTKDVMKSGKRNPLPHSSLIHQKFTHKKVYHITYYL